jgi:hypothetical protein
MLIETNWIADHRQVARHQRAGRLAVREDEADHDDVVLQDLVVELQRTTVLVDQLDVGEVITRLRFRCCFIGRRIAGGNGRGRKDEHRCQGSGPGEQVGGFSKHAAASRISDWITPV